MRDECVLRSVWARDLQAEAVLRSAIILSPFLPSYLLSYHPSTSTHHGHWSFNHANVHTSTVPLHIHILITKQALNRVTTNACLRIKHSSVLSCLAFCAAIWAFHSVKSRPGRACHVRVIFRSCLALALGVCAFISFDSRFLHVLMPSLALICIFGLWFSGFGLFTYIVLYIQFFEACFVVVPSAFLFTFISISISWRCLDLGLNPIESDLIVPWCTFRCLGVCICIILDLPEHEDLQNLDGCIPASYPSIPILPYSYFNIMQSPPISPSPIPTI